MQCVRSLCFFVALSFALPVRAQWKPLFDGKTLEGWRETQFPRRGMVKVESGKIVLHAGSPLTGINLSNAFANSNYEVRFEAARLQGNDFFASLTFPVGSSFGTWVLGGWGGDIVGFSSIDGWDASDNETRSYFTFEEGHWYTMRLVVRSERLQAWIDDKPVFDVVVGGRKISMRPGDIELSKPFGFASYATTGTLRKVEYRLLSAP